ncbi:thioredoxin-disulfide reductase [Methanobrevibacter sp. TMH8]|uniref:thioredoxin-disulfide reductase n=1 Tax=Methanobrevibacter sp. TMH8 TaxID=2848611 RepID=UPI001CCA331B|nr:thioredoxin-disulfide reductase [Methanobrevibacter sp. TMH8]MBZ9571306.1 thioredoxin-disulfide reductase [Methanobrevibacter sp. TMH8]
MEEYDIIIIGAGPGGLTAGLYAGRQGTKTLILDKGLTGGAGLMVPSMENYPGFDLIAGMSLIPKMKAQTEKNAEIHEMEGVESIDRIDNGFILKTTKDEYFAKSIIIATGATHRKLEVPGEDHYNGFGVSYCATCDGLLYKDKDILMIGGGNSALQEAIFLNNVGCNVTVVHRRDEFRAEKYLQNKLKEKGIPVIWNSVVEEIKGSQMVESVILSNIKDNSKQELKVQGIFIAIGDVPSSELAKELGVNVNKYNQIITDKTQRTNVENVYAIGDVTGGVKQWVVACGEGAIAATYAYQDLEQTKKRE